MKKQDRKTQPKSDEFTRFEQFTKCLLAVPRKEIEREKAKYEAKKSKRPAK